MGGRDEYSAIEGGRRRGGGQVHDDDDAGVESLSLQW
jgi:hypothetical protein